jgi:hypothetical protein
MSKQKEGQKSEKHEFRMLFGKENYLLTAVAFGVVILGFILMFGGQEDIYSFRKITLAPIVVLLGFSIGVIAIMRKPKKDA